MGGAPGSPHSKQKTPPLRAVQQENSAAGHKHNTRFPYRTSTRHTPQWGRRQVHPTASRRLHRRAHFNKKTPLPGTNVSPDSHIDPRSAPTHGRKVHPTASSTSLFRSNINRPPQSSCPKVTVGSVLKPEPAIDPADPGPPWEVPRESRPQSFGILPFRHRPT